MHLVEIPTTTEINDNIVAYWRPRNPTRAKGEYVYTYRIHWGAQMPEAAAARAGDRDTHRRRPGGDAADRARFRRREPEGDPAGRHQGRRSPADKGKVRNVVSQPNPETGGYARHLPARSRRREGDRAARAAAARRGRRCRKSGSTDGRRERVHVAPRGAGAAVPAARGAAGDAGAVAARAAAAPTAPASRPRRAGSPARRAFVFGATLALTAVRAPTRCIWCSRSAG